MEVTYIPETLPLRLLTMKLTHTIVVSKCKKPPLGYGYQCLSPLSGE